jgi:hypothetical protein
MFRKVVLLFSFFIVSFHHLIGQNDSTKNFKASQVSDTAMTALKGSEEHFFSFPELQS